MPKDARLEILEFANAGLRTRGAVTEGAADNEEETDGIARFEGCARGTSVLEEFTGNALACGREQARRGIRCMDGLLRGEEGGTEYLEPRA